MTDLPLVLGFWLGPINVILGYAVALGRNLAIKLLVLMMAALLIGVQLACGIALF